MVSCHAKEPCFPVCENLSVSDLKLLDDYDNEEAWKSAVSKRKFLFDRILKEYDMPELSGPEVDDDDDMQTEKVSKENNDQVGEGSGDSSKLNINLVSPSEQVALRAKDELLCEGRKCVFSGLRRKTQQRSKN